MVVVKQNCVKLPHPFQRNLGRQRDLGLYKLPNIPIIERFCVIYQLSTIDL